MAADTVVRALLWFSAIGCGMMAGLYFAFSAFIMRALGGIAQAHGVSAMQAINAVILRSWFLPLFYSTTLACLVLAVVGIARWGQPGAAAMAAGGIVYVVGMSLCTLACNVPLNLALDAVRADAAEAAPVWTRYLRDWTFRNHIRTLASMVASALFIAALAAE